ncbi:MAG: hypothetical protein QXH42_07645 [Thermoplasmata archaeon]
MFGAFVKLRVEKELWESVVRASGIEEPPGLASGLFKNHLKVMKESERLAARLKDTEEELKGARKTIEELTMRLEGERKAREEMRKELDSFWSYYRKLKNDYKAILKNPVVEERVVIRDNVAALEALARKRDSLQKEVWELRKKLAEAESARKEAEERERKLKDEVMAWSQSHYAVLAVISPTTPGQPPEVKARVLSSKEFYEWREQRQEFEAKRGLQGARYAVAPIE